MEALPICDTCKYGQNLMYDVFGMFGMFGLAVMNVDNAVKSTLIEGKLLSGAVILIYYLFFINQN